MKRRDFLKVASGAGGAATAAGGAAAAGDPSGSTLAQQSGTTSAGNETTAAGNETTTGGGNAGGGGTVTVKLVDYAYKPGTEEPLYISPGTTVKFVWETSTHNINVDSQPEGADWQGHMPVEGAGFTYTYTFQTKGEYTFHCDPHKNLGMKGTIVVNESGQPPGGGGAAQLDPQEMGVPLQAHFVGIATVLMMMVSLVFTFFVLKYGESPHASAPNK